MRSTELVVALQRAEQAFLDGATDAGIGVRAVLDRIEAATPGGAPLHAQLDNVRKWLGAFERPDDHQRFGGAEHLREYVVTQIRIAHGALEDYERQTG